MTLALCQRDPYRRHLTTQLLSCEPAPERGGFMVLLADTVLYPEGGGQPADGGTVNGEPVLDVQKAPEGGFVVFVERPLSVGEAKLEVDWARRYDHMQQHTAQHLISALAEDRLGAPTLSFHLGARSCSIDLGVASLPDEALERLEHEVNQAIRAALPVTFELARPEQLEALGVRTRGLPAGHSGDVRLVRIQGLDLNTCGGTHVASTAELQCVTFLGTEPTRGRTRLSFLAGARVLSRLRQVRAREVQMNGLLSCGPDEYTVIVDKILADQRRQRRQLKALRQELAQQLGAALARSGGGEGSVPGVVVCHREGEEAGFVGAVAKAFAAAAPELVGLFTGGARLGEGPFVVVGPVAVVERSGKEVASALQGRGGGRGGWFQGKGAGLGGWRKARAALVAALAAAAQEG